MRYQFFINRESEWPEMAALRATVRLQRLTFLGPLGEETEAMASGIDVPIARCDTLAAGFSRT